MDKRLNELYLNISTGDIFADVGCDHGKLSKAVLDGNKFNKVIISDISEKCLVKAKNLLKKYEDRVLSYVSDGFDNYTILPDEAVIAGMGGEEICSILKRVKPINRLILSPQKNVDKVRLLLLDLNYSLERDYIIKCQDKYYDIICAKYNKDLVDNKLSLLELEFGFENLQKRSDDFISYLKDSIEKQKNILKNDMSLEERKLREERLNRFIKLYENN